VKFHSIVRKVAIVAHLPIFGSMRDIQETELVPGAPAMQPGHAGLPSTADGWAIFLDVDGTLLDIAPRPDAIVVPDGLLEDLRLLSARVGGALALVSGRNLALLKRLFPDLPCSLAGLHGVEIEFPDGTSFAIPRSNELDAAVQALVTAAAQWPGVVVEDKGAAFAAHYRLAPRFAPAVEAQMMEIAEKLGDKAIVQRGKSVVEIRPSGHDKGSALKALMTSPPFAGRRPLAIGDDLTDEAMFEAANVLDGLSVRVGEPRATLARLAVSSPADIRSWIRSLVR
jgi:trehalose 6-phosphate phosphatase